MTILRFLLKSLIVCVLIAAIVIGGIFVYITFFGKGTIEGMLSRALGSQVRFEGVSFDINKGLVHFNGFTVMNKIEFEDNIFKADKFIVSIDRERFEKDKTFVFQEVFVERGTLTIERNRKGSLNIASITPSGKEAPAGGGIGGIAYAAELPKAGGLYDFVKNFKSIIIKDSIVNFKDYYISQKPFAVYLDNLNFEFIANTAPGESVGATCKMSLRIPMQNPPSGSAVFQADMAIRKERVDMEGTLQTKNINLMLFLPYLDRHTPFYFSSGIFSSNTILRIHNHAIDSPTTMLFHNLDLATKPGKENSQFLQTAVNRLVPYLQSGQGGVYFDFVIKGPVEKPQVGLGPKVKFAMGMVALEEFSKVMQQLQKLTN